MRERYYQVVVDNQVERERENKSKGRGAGEGRDKQTRMEPDGDSIPGP